MTTRRLKELKRVMANYHTGIDISRPYDIANVICDPIDYNEYKDLIQEMAKSLGVNTCDEILIVTGYANKAGKHMPQPLFDFIFENQLEDLDDYAVKGKYAGLTPLTYAIELNDKNLFDDVLAGGANPNEFDGNDVLPLSHAVLSLDSHEHAFYMIKELMKYGGDINGQDVDSFESVFPPINEIVVTEDLNKLYQVLKYVLENGGDPNLGSVSMLAEIDKRILTNGTKYSKLKQIKDLLIEHGAEYADLENRYPVQYGKRKLTITGPQRKRLRLI